MLVKLAAGGAVSAMGLAAVVAAQSAAPAKDPVRVKSDAIHAKVLTLDTHVDMRNGDYGVLTPGQKVDLVKMQQGGMKGAFLAVFVLRLGGSNHLVGLLTALPALITILWLVPAGGMIERQPKRLRLLIASSFLLRLACSRAVSGSWPESVKYALFTPRLIPSA